MLILILTLASPPAGTKLLYEYSYIEGVAIKIGDKILEVSSYGDYLLNGIVGADMPNKLSDSVVNYYKHSNHEHIFQVILSEQYNTTIEVSSFKSMLSIKFMNATEVHFGKSAGLMGEFGTGKKYARDGVTVLKDMDMFGQEWQVLDSEPKLFETTNRAPQHPQKCLMPEVSIDVQSTLRGRRLGESITKEAAQKVCADWKEDERDACIFDVIATGDLEMAQAGGF